MTLKQQELDDGKLIWDVDTGTLDIGIEGDPIVQVGLSIPLPGTNIRFEFRNLVNGIPSVNNGVTISVKGEIYNLTKEEYVILLNYIKEWLTPDKNGLLSSMKKENK